ncbi:M48 family metalloprotease [Acidianus sp. RZ1]|uniref:M48 family metalloprotease n=1 Tax=Acidianus sp. RZ1 TaxID=1540082 RepID=UPI001492ED59|nr:M48 family metalloprotease [Acidianus sp. RZ1]NON63222.1 M48 family metalloprotease [Acidianus sp. RZ1]
MTSVTRYWLRYYVISFITIMVIGVIITLIIPANNILLNALQIIIVFGLWYLISPFIMMMLLKMRRENAEIQSLVKEVAEKLRIKTPRVYVSYVNFPNAVAFGNIFFRGMAVTYPLTTMLNQEEIKAVIAHELSHLKNKDPETLILALMGIDAIYVTLVYTAFNALGGIIFFVYLFILFPLFYAIHRHVEKRADITAVKNNREFAVPLQTALIKIAYLSNLMPSNLIKNLPELQVLFAKYDIMSMENRGISLFRTHPYLSDRLRYLSEYE